MTRSAAARPCEATVDLDAFRANVSLALSLAGARDLIAVVKADAYGHGAGPIGHAALEAGARALAVLTVDEAVTLREEGITAPILVLAGARDEMEAEAAVHSRLVPVLHGREGLSCLESAARMAGARVPVHVEVDSGMRRMGVPSSGAVAFLARVSESEHLDLDGVFTHFARADEPDLEPSLAQAALFRAVLAEARERGIEPRTVHADNSAALLAGKLLAEALPEATAVRPGLMLYGVRPAPHLDSPLQPAMTSRASVLAVHEVGEGEPVGYGGTYRAPAGGTRVATVSVGYADGVPWNTAGSGQVWLAGARRPIAGRVSMDSIGVDVGRDVQVRVGDEVIVFGGSRARGLPLEAAAEAAGTLHYELLVRVGARVPRIVVGG